MKLHIVMPVINCLELTKGAYQSILDSQAYDWKFILIDNVSSDGTEEWSKLQEEAATRPFQYLYNFPRKGVAESWNQGIKMALEDKECEYIAILNNDIILHPKTLNHLMAFMNKTGYLMVTADNIADKMSVETLLRMELPKEYTDYDLWPIDTWRAEGPDFSCFMISPKTVEVVGFFDENFKGAYCEDQDYHRRFKAAREHAEQHNDLKVNPKRIHTKRLSTAPYYHFASETVKRNVAIRHDVAVAHGKNENYYLKKWGASHPDAMDGLGNKTPFGDASKNWRDW